MSLSSFLNRTICLNRPKRRCGLDCSATLVRFHLPKRVSFGSNVFLIGDDARLGAWGADSGVSLRWSDGDLWTTEVELDPGTSVSYKYLVKNADGSLNWQPGSDLVLKIPEDTPSLQLTDSWEGAPSEIVAEPTPAEEASTKEASPEKASPVEEAAPVPVEVASAAATVVDEQPAAVEEVAVPSSSASDSLEPAPEVLAKEAAPSVSKASKKAATAPQAASAAAPPAPKSSPKAATGKAAKKGSTASPKAAASSGERSIDDLSIKDLKAKLKELGEPVTGRKFDLLARLKAAMAKAQ